MTTETDQPIEKSEATQQSIVVPLQTERLEIHRHTINRPECTGGIPRTVFHAWLKQSTTGEDVSKPLVIVTLGMLNFVEWVHTDEDFRRQGLATEALRAIEESVGTLTMDGATELGDAFCESYEAKFPNF